MNSILSFSPTLLVMVGGAAGAGLRYHLGRYLFHFSGSALPWGTFAANVIGGFAMGLFVGTLARGDMTSEPWRLLLGVGLLGGFTTFSAFSLEAYLMIERGQWGMAGFYAAGSVLLSIAALFGGLFLTRSMA